MANIRIATGGFVLEAELNDSATAREIFERLPLAGQVNRWGDEFYFKVPLRLALEADARAGVQAGELGYWPMGPAFCIFFGPTPASTDDNPRAYSPVNVFGRIIGDTSCLRQVADGAEIRVSAA